MPAHSQHLSAATLARQDLASHGLACEDPGLSPELDLLADDVFAGWKPQAEAQLERCAAAGQALAQQAAWPLLAAQTWFSRLEGTLGPAAWKAFLHGAARADARLLLADRDDLAGLPAALSTWGRERVAVGALCTLPGHAEALLLAPDHRAYSRLCRLLSYRAEERAAWDLWPQGRAPAPDGDGLIALVQDNAWVARLRACGMEVYSWLAQPSNQPLPGTAAVAAPLVRHRDGQDARLAKLLQALRSGTHLGRRAQAEPAPAQLQLWEQPALITQFPAEALERGRELLARCTYTPGDDLHLPPWHDGDADALLRQLAEQGLPLRYPMAIPQEARERLEHELTVIRGKGFASYILTVYQLAQQRRTCGRGSAASSMVCYLLGLTNVDPVRYHLVFERFLAPERTDPPDIDLDFPWDERDQVFAAALAYCGRAHVALVATHLCFRPWSALREVARVRGQPRASISAVKGALRAVGRFGGAIRLPTPWPELLQQAEQLLGAPRHYGLHPGGVVVTTAPIRELVPVHPAAKQVEGQPLPAMAWEKDGAEALGLIKIDLLGNRSLAVVRDCLADLAERGIAIDERRWHPADDPAARRLVAQGATLGCFYIESPAMRLLNAKVGSGDFDRLVLHSSIIRPAANRWIEDYIARYHQWRASGTDRPEWYAHPALRALLSQSFGLISYQEDVMLAARELAGFTSRQQNQLRKALGKTDTGERLQAFAAEFRQGCQERGVSTQACALVWDMISSFAGYSFCKAHSASYAMVSFQCAWLKAHHPAVFLARVIANGGGFYLPSAYLEEARRLGVTIRGPCVLRSAWATRAETEGVLRCGLHLVPGLSHASAQRILAAQASGQITSASALLRVCRMTTRELQMLEQSGALNRLLARCHAGQRRQLITQLIGQKRQLPEHDPEVDPYAPKPADTHVLWERWRFLGFLPQMHPLLLWPVPDDRVRLAQITPRWQGRSVQVFAACITRKQVAAHTSKGTRAMCFASFEDDSALLEGVLFPDIYAHYGHHLDYPGALLVHGRIQVDHGVPCVHVERLERLSLPPGIRE